MDGATPANISSVRWKESSSGQPGRPVLSGRRNAGAAGLVSPLARPKKRRCDSENVARKIKAAPRCQTRGSGYVNGLLAAAYLKAELLTPQMEANCARIGAAGDNRRRSDADGSEMMSEKGASHLALSLPCDLMKFIFLYLDRKATSWLLVLKRRQKTQPH